MITSVQNPLVKYIVKLTHKSSFRKKEKKFVVEGGLETERALQGGFILEKVIVCPEIFNRKNWLETIPASKIVEVNRKVYAHLAYRGGTEGILAVGLQKDFTLTNLSNEDTRFMLVAERIQKPGNIGALLRTSDAAGTSAVIFISPGTDLYNPNVIRASLGTLFTQKIAVASLEEFKQFKSEHSFRLYAATLQNSNVYWKEQYTGNIAIAVGNEHDGLTGAFRQLSDLNVYIPMNGTADSLNLSVSAGIILYEVLRQRSGNKS